LCAHLQSASSQRPELYIGTQHNARARTSIDSFHLSPQVWASQKVKANEFMDFTIYSGRAGFGYHHTISKLFGIEAIELCPKVGDGLIRRRFEVA
jgi:hypothetical protein